MFFVVLVIFFAYPWIDDEYRRRLIGGTTGDGEEGGLSAGSGRGPGAGAAARHHEVAAEASLVGTGHVDLGSPWLVGNGAGVVTVQNAHLYSLNTD